MIYDRTSKIIFLKIFFELVVHANGNILYAFDFAGNLLGCLDKFFGERWGEFIGVMLWTVLTQPKLVREFCSFQGSDSYNYLS